MTAAEFDGQLQASVTTLNRTLTRYNQFVSQQFNVHFNWI